MPRIPTFRRRSRGTILCEAVKQCSNNTPSQVEGLSRFGAGSSTKLELLPTIPDLPIPQPPPIPIPAPSIPTLPPSVPAPPLPLLAPPDVLMSEWIAKPRSSERAKLELWLNWQPGQYQVTRDYIHELSQQHLDLRQPLHRQPDGTKVELVSREASLRYPLLLSYKGNWVFLEILWRYLKNKSSRLNGKSREGSL